MFKILHIDHIGIGVNDLAAIKDVFGEKLGMFHQPEDEVVAEQKVKVSFFPCGDAELEFLESTAPDGPIAKAIAKRGEGLHHVAFEVADIRAEMARLKAAGFQLLSDEPKPGADNKLVCFVHPKDVTGVLFELTQEQP